MVTTDATVTLVLFGTGLDVDTDSGVSLGAGFGSTAGGGARRYCHGRVGGGDVTSVSLTVGGEVQPVVADLMMVVGGGRMTTLFSVGSFAMFRGNSPRFAGVVFMPGGRLSRGWVGGATGVGSSGFCPAGAVAGAVRPAITMVHTAGRMLRGRFLGGGSSGGNMASSINFHSPRLPDRCMAVPTRGTGRQCPTAGVNGTSRGGSVDMSLNLGGGGSSGVSVVTPESGASDGGFCSAVGGGVGSGRFSKSIGSADRGGPGSANQRSHTACTSSSDIKISITSELSMIIDHRMARPRLYISLPRNSSAERSCFFVVSARSWARTLC